MSAAEKSKILVLVADSGLPRRRALGHLGMPKSTYYRWLKRQGEGMLQDKKGGSSIPWNKLRPKEVNKILTRARASPELSSRQLALRLVDQERWYVSESTVFRILKREGLITVTQGGGVHPIFRGMSLINRMPLQVRVR